MHVCENAGMAQRHFCAGGGIEFHRQRHEVEEHDHAPSHRHQEESGVGVDESGEQPDQRKPHDDLAGDPRRPDGRHAEMQGRVGLGMLHGMARLVRCHRERGHRGAMVVALAQHQLAMRGIVVVGEFAGAGGDGNAIHAGILKNAGGGLCASHSCEGRLGVVFAVNTFHPHGGPEGQPEGSDKEKEW